MTGAKVRQRRIQKEEPKVQKQRPVDFTLCITVLLLLALGIVMVLSASSPSALAESGNSYSYVTKQVLAAGLGLAAMYVISKIDYKQYKKLDWFAYIISAILLISVYFIGEDINGAKRWILLGPLGQFQPSELAKIGLIVFFASYLTNNKDNLKTFIGGFVKPMFWVAIPVLILVLFQDHLSASVVVVAIVSVMMLVAGTRLLHFISAGTVVGSAGITGLLVMAKLTGKGDFRLDRITSFMDPWADATGTGWQITQSLYAIGSGGLFGAGLRAE